MLSLSRYCYILGTLIQTSAMNNMSKTGWSPQSGTLFVMIRPQGITLDKKVRWEKWELFLCCPKTRPFSNGLLNRDRLTDMTSLYILVVYIWSQKIMEIIPVLKTGSFKMEIELILTILGDKKSKIKRPNGCGMSSSMRIWNVWTKRLHGLCWVSSASLILPKLKNTVLLSGPETNHFHKTTAPNNSNIWIWTDKFLVHNF